MSHPEFISLPDNVLWQRALLYYAAHDWFMVHEALEVLWKRSQGQDAAFYQALLQAAVSLYHYGNANFSGARQLARSALEALARFPTQFHGIDVSAFANDFGATLKPVLEGAAGLRPLEASAAPRIQSAR